jgi:hypothetical protein
MGAAVLNIVYNDEDYLTFFQGTLPPNPSNAQNIRTSLLPPVAHWSPWLMTLQVNSYLQEDAYVSNEVTKKNKSKKDS